MNFQTTLDAMWDQERILDMKSYDQLPAKIRAWIQENGDVFPCKDILYDVQHGKSATDIISELEDTAILFSSLDYV
jgi:hypothetical protein